MRPRTIALLLLGMLAVGWYVAEPSTGPEGAIRTPAPEGTPNPLPLAILAVAAALVLWPWVREIRRRRE